MEKRQDYRNLEIKRLMTQIATRSERAEELSPGLHFVPQEELVEMFSEALRSKFYNPYNTAVLYGSYLAVNLQSSAYLEKKAWHSRSSFAHEMVVDDGEGVLEIVLGEIRDEPDCGRDRPPPG